VVAPSVGEGGMTPPFVGEVAIACSKSIATRK
jgi:hypothetical protein